MRMPAWGSLLFVPADDEARCAKACRAGADAVILDLEDGVAPAAKAAARARVAPAARALAEAGVAAVVRINAPWRAALADLEAAVGADVAAVMVPKAEDGARLAVLSDMIGELEAERGLEAGSTSLVALVETPAALARLPDIAAAPRVVGLALGTEDFCLGLGVAPTPAALDLPSRQIALAAAARGQMALAVPLSITQFRDIEAYRAAALAGAATGVNGAICIHPAQAAAANACFAPAEAELADARRVLDAWERAQAGGLAVTALDGRMIDLPVAERARRLVARAGG